MFIAEVILAFLVVVFGLMEGYSWVVVAYLAQGIALAVYFACTDPGPAERPRRERADLPPAPERRPAAHAGEPGGGRGGAPRTPQGVSDRIRIRAYTGPASLQVADFEEIEPNEPGFAQATIVERDLLDEQRPFRAPRGSLDDPRPARALSPPVFLNPELPLLPLLPPLAPGSEAPELIDGPRRLYSPFHDNVNQSEFIQRVQDSAEERAREQEEEVWIIPGLDAPEGPDPRLDDLDDLTPGTLTPNQPDGSGAA